MSQERKESYVYILFRPNGVPCYVGKGVGNRWLRHEWQTHNLRLARIIKSAGGSLPKIKIREGLTDAEAHETEQAFIAAIGRVAHGGPLVNFEHTELTKQKMSAASKGKPKSPEHVEKIRQRMMGNVPSEATRAKLSAAHSGRITTPEHAKAISKAKKGICSGPMPEHQRIAIGAALKGRERSEAEVAAIRAGQAKMTEEQKLARLEKVREKLVGRPLSEEHRKKISEDQRGRTRSPEFRAKVSASMKALRAAQRAAKEALNA
jgi:hypothetical protein